MHPFTIVLILASILLSILLWRSLKTQLTQPTTSPTNCITVEDLSELIAQWEQKQGRKLELSQRQEDGCYILGGTSLARMLMGYDLMDLREIVACGGAIENIELMEPRNSPLEFLEMGIDLLPSAQPNFVPYGRHNLLRGPKFAQYLTKHPELLDVEAWKKRGSNLQNILLKIKTYPDSSCLHLTKES